MHFMRHPWALRSTFHLGDMPWIMLDIDDFREDFGRREL